MESANKIQYDTAVLKVQWENIGKSRLDAMKKNTRKTYSKIVGLGEDDPSELWQFAISLCQPPTDLTQDTTAKSLVKHFQQLDPQFAGDAEAYRQFRDFLGTPTLHDIVLALVHRFQDAAELAKHLKKLLAIYKHGPISQAEWESNHVSKTGQLLLLNWIQEPFGNITGSLAFFSDRAMAEMVHHLQWGKPLPQGRRTSEPERIRKVYHGLGLVPADQRAVKDLHHRAGRIHFVLNKTLTPKGR